MLASFQLLAQAQRKEHPVEAEHEQFLQAGRWMRQHDLPRFVFCTHISGGKALLSRFLKARFYVEIAFHQAVRDKSARTPRAQTPSHSFEFSQAITGKFCDNSMLKISRTLGS
jgi:hypothetical protein